jgi:hypothetical protein
MKRPERTAQGMPVPLSPVSQANQRAQRRGAEPGAVPVLALHDLPEMFGVRGIVFCHETVRDWEAKLTPALAEDLRRHRRGKVGCGWYVDETYVKVHGRWCYLYRAINRLPPHS